MSFGLKRIVRCIIIGAPGAGKGTLAKNLASALDMVHVSTGDIIWSNIYQKTKLGALAETYVRKGELVPDGIMSSLLLKVLDKLEKAEVSWVIDGYPRTERQAAFLWSKVILDMAIHLNLPVKESFKRHESKLVHIPSGRTYGDDYNKPLVTGRDDITGGKLEYRDDFHKDIVLKRYEAYENHKANILKFYDKLGILYSFKDGFNDKTFDDVKGFIQSAKPHDDTLVLL